MSIKKTALLFLFISGLLDISGLYAGPLIVPAPPEINATSYLVMDFDSGRMLVEKNINEKLPLASLTKIMTVYVVFHELESGKIRLDDRVIVSEKAWRMQGSRMFIEVDKEVSVEDLLKGVIIQSGNDASVALAEYVSGSEDVFAGIMNNYAKKLGMLNTHFVNSTGLPDEQHYSTAKDLAILAQALIREFPDHYKWHSTREFTYNKIKQHNRNRLLWIDPSVDGVKTGHTNEAGYCLIASAKRDEMRLISVILGAETEKARTRSTQSLLNYAYRFYETRKIYNANEPVTTARVWKGETRNLELGIDHDLYVTIPRDQSSSLDTVIDLEKEIKAPVMVGQKLGIVKINYSGEELLSESLVALQNIAEGNIFNRLKDDIQLLFQ